MYHLDNLRKSNILPFSCALPRNANPSHFVSEIIWISIDSKPVLKEGGEEEETAGLKREKEPFNWKQHSVTASKTGQEQICPLTKMQFYRHTRADFMWVRNTPAACQVSKGTEPQWF